MGEIPFTDQRNVHNMDEEAHLRQGRGRFSIMMYYPDGRNTEVRFRTITFPPFRSVLNPPLTKDFTFRQIQPETREWRPERRAARRRPPPVARPGEGRRPGVRRAWPVFEIHAEDPLCHHHLPASWEVEDMNNRVLPPACTFCRSRAYAVYFRCRTCGIVACSMHNSVRFGLTWAVAVRVRDGLRNRVWFEPRGRRGDEDRRGELFCFVFFFLSSGDLYLLGVLFNFF
ncbi:hypothetical protein BDP55DRAFT_650282 [Colletotrichum godetiae]|uniref:Uncharacterized protein n=1 Tax=Colletotrichum godetiae TaxID=1209918 RepID=A0AAJ0AVG6_9PEZI|nr:uncharacterized protein BDP55DRAFT_650282 [Colletotrichum godetiae]KAK1690332.1 hypothetical protein BDP55DRAFT_650282 [Colletotrichum godetiae]